MPTQHSPYVNGIIEQHHTLWKNQIIDSQYDHDTSDDSENTTTPDGVEYPPNERGDIEHDESSDTDDDEVPDLEPAQSSIQGTLHVGKAKMQNRVPTSVREAMLIDKANGNHRWKQALDDEIKWHGSYGNQLSALKWQSLAKAANVKNEQEDDELQEQEDDNTNIVTTNDYKNKLFDKNQLSNGSQSA